MLAEIATFRAIAEEKWATVEKSGIGSAVDQHFDDVFRDFHDLTDKVETALRDARARDLRRFRVTQALLIAVCLAVFTGLVFWRYERRHALDTSALCASEELYRAVAEDLPVLICRFLPGGEITYVNDAYCKYFGKSSEELVGRTFLSLIPEADRQTMMANIGALTVDSPKQSHEHHVTAPGGGSRWQRWTNRALCDATGKIVAYQAAGEDITRRKRAEDERGRLLSAVEQAVETFVITDAEGTIQYVNQAFERTSGYTREEALGRNPRILKSNEHDAAFYKELWDTLLRGKAWSGRLANKKKDGTLYTEEMIISPVRDASGKTVNYVAVKRDITEEIKLEEQFRQAQKMESVGRLAGGVAHDFNNMLSVILGHTEMALLRVDADQIHADLMGIQTAVERSEGLTRQLLAFASKQTVAPSVLDLNETVGGILKMLPRLIGEDIALSWLPGAGVWPVKVDPTQIDQILTNLCVNARDAIKGVGKVIIETGNATLNEADCLDHLELAPGEYVLLAVSDDGCGMDKTTQDSLFEPFFTTKETGKGTGLGMATVYGIVKQNSGFISVFSEPGQGTTVKIYLPRHAAEEAAREQEKLPAESAGRGHETILLVEDEPAILRLTTEILEARGYTVLAAARPGEAVRLAEARPDAIHLLVTDVVMPEMNGPNLAKKLLSFCPNLKIMFMSAYTANVISRRGMLDEGMHFIQKPFASQDLLAKVRETLDSQIWWPESPCLS